MRLDEIAFPRLYLGLSKPAQLGSEIQRRSAETLGIEREKFLEDARPEDALSRKDCVCLFSQPPEGEFLYEARPYGQRSRNHTSWLKLLEHADISDVEALRGFAEGYWSEKPNTEHLDLPWEYRSSHARVSELVYSRQRAGSQLRR